MKKLFALVLLLISNDAFTAPQTAESIRAPSMPTIELLANGGFEGGKAAWVASSPSTFTIDTVTPLNGGGSAVFTPTAGSQTLTSAQYPVKAGLFGGNCAATMRYKTAETTNGFTLQVINGSSVVLATQPVPFSPSPQIMPLSFPCGSSGTIAFRLLSSGSALPIELDDATLGLNNLIQLSQAQYFGGISVSGGGSCAWSSTTGSFADFSAASGCVYTTKANATAPATQLPAITFPSMPAGEYYFVGRGDTFTSHGSASGFCDARFYDGTTSLGVQPWGGTMGGSSSFNQHISNFTGHLSLANVASSKTIAMQFTDLTGTGSQCEIDSTSGIPFTIDVYYYPTQASVAMTAATSALLYRGHISGSGCSYSLSSGTQTDFTESGTCALTQDTNTNAGTVTKQASLPGISINLQAGQTYQVCFESDVNHSASGGGNIYFTDGTTEISRNGTVAPSTIYTPFSLCGQYKPSATGPVGLKIQGAESGDNLVVAGGGLYIGFSVALLSQQVPAPLLVGTVVSPSAGVENIVRFKFAGGSVGVACASDPCGVYLSNTAGIVVNRLGTADYNITFPAGTFSAAPVCVFQAGDGTAPAAPRWNIGSVTSTSFELYDGNLAANFNGNIICMGPK